MCNNPCPLARRPRRAFATAAGALGLALLAGPTLAHTGTGLPGGFLAGLEHPLGGPDHLLAMVAVGLWGAFLGRPLIVALPVIFPAVMSLGGIIGIVGLPFPPVEIGIAVSVLFLGAAIAGGIRAPVPVACLMVGFFGLFHGYAHGAELPSAADPIGYSIGFVLMTGTLHVVGIALGLLCATPRGVLLARGFGCAITVIGILFLSRAVIA